MDLSAEFSPDATRILTRTNRGPGGEVRIWDSATGRHLLILAGNFRSSPRSSPRTASGSPQGTMTGPSASGTQHWHRGPPLEGPHEFRGTRSRSERMANCSSRPRLTARRRSGTPRPARQSPCSGAGASSERRHSAGSQARGHHFHGRGANLDGRGRKEVLVFKARRWYGNGELSPDGGAWVLASDGKTARILDSFAGREITVLRGHDGEIGSIAFRPGWASGS